MDPAFFTVRTPCARTHQQQLSCMHERTGMHEPVCMLAAAAGCWLLAAAGYCCASNSSSHQQPFILLAWQLLLNLVPTSVRTQGRGGFNPHDHASDPTRAV
jgi:hypothetical protein